MSEAAAICLRRASLPTVTPSQSCAEQQRSAPGVDPLEALDTELELPLEEPRLTWAVDLGHELLALSTVDLWYALNTGSVRPDVKVWCVGREAWARAAEVPELACALRFSRPFIEGQPPRSTLDYALRLPSFGVRMNGVTPRPQAVSPYDDTPLPLGVLPAPPGLSPSPAPCAPAASATPCAPDSRFEQRVAPDPLDTWFDKSPQPCQLDRAGAHLDACGPVDPSPHSLQPACSDVAPRSVVAPGKRRPKSWLLAAPIAAALTVAVGISLAAGAPSSRAHAAPMLATEDQAERAEQPASQAATQLAGAPAAERAARPSPSSVERPAPDLPVLAPPPAPTNSERKARHVSQTKPRKKTWSPSRRGQERRRQSSR